MKRHPGGEEQTRRMLAHCGFAQGERVLDMGAGEGKSVRLLRALGCAAEGIDLEPRGSGVCKGNLLRTDYADGSFDGVISECTFYASGDQEGAFREAARLLRRGGVLAVTDVFYESAEEMAARAGLRVLYEEDLTPQWKEYYIEAIWRGEAEYCGGGKCSYKMLIGRKE